MICFLLSPENYFKNTLVVVKSTEEREVSLFEAKEIDKKGGNIDFFGQFKEIFSQPLFICCLIMRAIVIGTLTAIHYWIGDYMRTVLMVEGTKVFGSYTVIAIIGPIGGLGVGSITNYFFGGYEQKHSSLTMIFTHLISCACGITGTFFDSVYYFCILTTLFFVFNSVAYPLLNGMTLISVKPEYKSTAFTISNFFAMLFTSGPFPFMYGAINDYCKTTYPRMAMLCLMLIMALGLIPMVIMAILRYKDFEEKEKKEAFITNDIELQTPKK